MSQEGLECGASLIASNRLLRVTMLSSEWRSTKGGLSTINRELAIQLAKHHNVEVSMYLPQCGDEDKRAAGSHNVCLIEAKEMPGYDPVDWLASIPKDHVMDCVIGHGVHLGRQVSHIKQTHHDCKWIQIVHTDPEELGMFKRYANPISRGEKKRRAEVQLCQSADQVVAVGSKLSEAFSHYLRSCGKDQDVFNLTPSIFTEFKDVRQAPGERQSFSVLVFGRGDSEDLQLKGYDIAAKAISELKDMPQPYKLVFVGAPVGEEEKVKELLLKEGISPTQLAVRAFNENREQLAELFQEVDLVIMPSRTEGFGLTALEALSAGLPVLVTGNSGFGEALKKVPFGSNCVVNSEDPKEWAKAIRAVREKDRAVRLKESELLRGEYGKEYSWQEQCDRLAERMLNFTFGRLHLRLDCTFNSTSRSGAGEALGIPAATQEPESVGTLPASILAQAVVPDGNARETVGNVGSPSPSPEEVMCFIARKLFDKADLSNKEDRNDYLCYLEKVRNVLVCDYCKGSLIIMLQCSSLQILEELWEDYCTGHLNQMAQQFLVTEEVLQTFGLTEVELTTTIFEEEYRACQQYFGQLSGSSERRLTEDWPHSNTIHWGGSTLPTPVSPGAVEDARNRFSSDLQHLLVPEPFQSIPAQELLKDNCRKCGWIRKEQDIINTWRDRYVILHKGCFYYYNKPEATMTAGKFSLSGYRLSPAPEKSYQWTFKLVHLQPEKRTYYFAACSEKEMNDWMENINKEMEEYCGTVKPRRQESIEYGDGAEYCYPEVEPKFDPEEFAALFGKPSPSLPKIPATEQPEPPEIEPRDMPKKSPNQLPRPGSPLIQKRSEWPKGCSVSNIGAIRLPDAASSALRPPKPFPGSSPVLPRNPNQALYVPSRAAKPPAALPAATSPQSKPKPKPKPLPRLPPLEKHTLEPILNYGSVEGLDEDEAMEGYLDIVPDTTPDDVVEKGKKSTLSRGFPDGNSFRRHHREDVLSSSAASVLDMDKAEVTRVLENKLGVYILRKSENAQSKRALAVWTGDRVRHYLIFYEEKKGYTLDPTEGKNFETLEDLLLYYYKNYLPKCDIKLIRPFKT